MPAYPWLAKSTVVPQEMPPRMRALRMVGVPYSDAEIAAAEKDVTGKTELDALIAYLQILGTTIKSRGAPALPVQPAQPTQSTATAVRPAASLGSQATPGTPGTADKPGTQGK